MAETHREGRPSGRATIRDIARLAGVSVATVSRVINDRPDVAPDTRDAVLRHVREHNFTTNRSARALSGGRTGHIGLTMPLIRADYFAAILSGALEAVYEQDMRLVLYTTLHEHDREVSVLEHLTDGATDGAIIMLPEESTVELAALQTTGYPFVVADPRVPLGEGIPAVSAAHRAGAKAATDHLLALGHRRIALVTGRRGWAATVERLDGYHASLAAASGCRRTSSSSRATSRFRADTWPGRRFSIFPSPRRRSSPRTTTWPSASCAPRVSAASWFRISSRSSGSTTRCLHQS